MNKLYIIIIFSIFSGNICAQDIKDSELLDRNSKEIGSSKIKDSVYPHLFWGFSFGAGMFGLNHSNENIQVNNDLSFGAGIYFELQIKRWLSTEIGGYYTAISGSASLSNYETSFENVDDMGINYVHMVDAQDIEEEMEAKVIEIPIALKFIWNPGNWNFYLKPGLSYTLISDSEYLQQSTVGISGYYSQNNVTFNNLPQHGYFLATEFESNGELALENSINPFIGAGVTIAGKGKTGVLFIEGKYYPGNIDFSNQEGDGTLFEGPMDNQEIGSYNFESITEEGTINLGGFFVQIGFRF